MRNGRIKSQENVFNDLESSLKRKTKMNSCYEVLWTNVAENDLKDIVEYIAEEDPTANRIEKYRIN